MATTSTDGEANLIATARKMVKSLSSAKEFREDTLLILSEYDECFSGIAELVEEEEQFDEAEKIILANSTQYSPDQFAQYLDAVDMILNLMEQSWVQFDIEIMNRAETAIEVAMSRLEDAFRRILIKSAVLPDPAMEVSVDHLINPDVVFELKDIADLMVRSGCEKKCIQAYSNVRRNALDEFLVTILGVKKMNKWVQAVKIVVRVILSSEKKLIDQIFNVSNDIKQTCFNETVKGLVMQLLHFGEAVAIRRTRSPEKLFRILDMYDVMAETLPEMEALVPDEIAIGEAREVLAGLGEAARETVAEFENEVRNDSRKPMRNGEVHQLSVKVMNYVMLMLKYMDSLNLLLESGDLASRLLLLIASLESKLEEKSRIYKETEMQYIFLMNNVSYIMQKVKDSGLAEALGDHWICKRRDQIRQYARDSWCMVLSFLKDEDEIGKQNMGFKERFKNFNSSFKKNYGIQRAYWKVSDAQLREELWVSVSEKVIPTYRSFVERFRSQVEISERRVGKYIKYTPEDLENCLMNLFEGSSDCSPSSCTLKLLCFC